MIDELMLDTEEKMEAAISSLKNDFVTLRAGRANPQMLDRIHVDYYGADTPVNQLANISVPEGRLLVIQPWDKSTIALIEKAILKSDIGITPSSDGSVIRLAIPQLTQERRLELVKLIKKMAEETKVRIRNVRRDANDKIKKMEKDKEITEDESKIAHEDIQELTNKFIADADKALAKKEEEVTEI